MMKIHKSWATDNKIPLDQNSEVPGVVPHNPDL